MINTLLNGQSKTITGAAIIIIGGSFLSRFVGLAVRNVVLIWKFGVGQDLDIYYAAFRIPDLVFNIIILGAVSTAFIPVFIQFIARDKNLAWKLTNSFFNISMMVLIGTAAVGLIFARRLMEFIAPGFSPHELDSASSMTRIMFLSPIFFGASSIFGGIIQSFKRFLAYALAPLLYNIGIIIGALFFSPFAGLNGLAWGVAFGAFLHMFFQFASARSVGYRYSFIMDFKNSGVRKILTLMIPRTLGLIGIQINYIVITAIASTLVAGSIAMFNLANDIQYIPVVFGLGFSVAAFSWMSHSYVEGRKDKIYNALSLSLRQIMFFVLPLTVLFIVLRAQVVRVVYGIAPPEQFDWTHTRIIAASLAIFVISAFAQSLVPLFAKTFYAMHNTKTPVAISLISMLINILGSFGFVWLIKNFEGFRNLIVSWLRLEGVPGVEFIGLPLAFSLSAVLNLFFLYFALRFKDKNFNISSARSPVFRIFIAAVVSGASVYSILNLLSDIIDTKKFLGVFAQGFSAGVFGILIYVLILTVLKSEELILFIKAIERRLKKSEIPSEINSN